MKSMLAIIVLTYILATFAQDDQIVLTGTLYDFANKDSGLPAQHPDFNSYLCGLQRGMVETDLGADKKPVLAKTANCLTSKDTFDQWFRSTDGVNIASTTSLVAHWDGNSKSYKYSNNNFFPLDGQGFGNEGKGHNYGFCFELHTSFTYQTGQVFDFMGDDDVWVFINNKLAIDLGGVHASESGSAQLDTLGLTIGNTYDLDFFFCERHVTGSNLIFSTSIVLDPCGTADSDGDGSPDLCDNCPKGNPVLTLSYPEVITTGLTVAFEVSLNVPVVEPITVRINFGDGSGDIGEWTYIANGVTTPTTIVHTFPASGEYNIVAESGVTNGGCKESGWSGSIKVGGDRKAPSCEAIRRTLPSRRR